MVSITSIVTAPGIPTRLNDLGDAHRLTPSKIRLFERYYGLRHVPLATRTQHEIFAYLINLLRRQLDLRGGAGLLIHAKTQSHNTTISNSYFDSLISECNLTGWESVAFTMANCASALAAVHLLKLMNEERPVILLTGEKAFHPAFSVLPVGPVGELFAAMLLNSGGCWKVTKTAVTHAPQFFKGLEETNEIDRRAANTAVVEGVPNFLRTAFAKWHITHDDIDLVIPYNINKPFLEFTASNLNLENKVDLQGIPEIGHAFCSDIPFNLHRVLTHTQARRILTFSVGLGYTFAAALLERS